MLQLQLSLLLTEMSIIITLIFKTPLRKQVIVALDRLKRGRAPIIVKTVSATLFLLMLTTLFNFFSIRRRSIHHGDLNPTDQILAVNHLLQASLLGFSLFLALMIDRLHHYIRELHIRRKNMEAVKKQNRVSEDTKAGELKSLEEERAALLQKVNKLETELKEKSKEVSTAKANSVALKKQSEGFLMEYDRLQEENQNLRIQLKSLDRRLSYSDNKKVT